MSQNSSYPERFVMQDLGYNSKAVHFAYAKRALVKIAVTAGIRTANRRQDFPCQHDKP
jgi:hypothetical protein